MAEPLQSDARYEQLINQLSAALQPVGPLWPVWAKLFAMVLLEALLFCAFAVFIGPNRAALGPLSTALKSDPGLIFAAGMGAGWLSFRSSVPGRGPRPIEVALLAIVALGAATLVIGIHSIQNSGNCTGICLTVELLALACLPWAMMLWWAREAAPLKPRLTAGLAGAAASLFAFATLAALQLDALSGLIAWGLFPALLITGVSAFLGRKLLLDRDTWAERRLHYARLRETDVEDSEIAVASASGWKPLVAAFRWPMIVIPAVAVALLVLILLPHHYRSSELAGRVPDFDIAIAAYQQATKGFEPNVPSASADTIASAYIDHGLPPYVWDFGREGYRLIGGRVGSTPEGNPAAFTLYRRGENSSIICMIAQTHRLHPPPGMYAERHHYRFYDYRGYRIGICYYGVYAAVMVSRIPMEEFVNQVAAVVPQS